VHDFLDILGVPTDAAASEVRRACARRVRRIHPDFSDVGSAREVASPPGDARTADIAIDFADMRTFIDRIQAAFFAPGQPESAGDAPRTSPSRPANATDD
jgi:hypothetical protein